MVSGQQEDYEKTLRDPAKSFLDELSPQIADLTDTEVTPKLFRINRDVRFSGDKTPYNTHLHMMWSLQTGARQNPVLFFGVGLDYVTVGAGMPEFSKDVLADWRKMVDLDGDRIAKLIADVGASGFKLSSWSPALKRVPPPFDKEHPHGDLLRQKGLTVSGEIGASMTPEADVMAAIKTLWPVADMLIGVAETPVI